MEKSTAHKCAEFALKARRWVSISEISKAIRTNRSTCRGAVMKLINSPDKYRAESKLIRDGNMVVRVLRVEKIMCKPQMSGVKAPIPVIATCEKTGEVIRFRSIKHAHINGYNWSWVKMCASTGRSYAGMKWEFEEAAE